MKPLPPAIPTAAADARPADELRASELDLARRRHWRATLRLTAALLAAWWVVGFGVTWFARDLDFAFFGWPFSFWVAAQGGALVFVGLLVAYARRMRRIDGALRAEGVRLSAGEAPGGAAR